MNYMGYALGQQGSIKGNVNFSSNFLDLNEFMTDSETSSADTASYGVIQVPTNIDFVLKSSINASDDGL